MREANNARTAYGSFLLFARVRASYMEEIVRILREHSVVSYSVICGCVCLIFSLFGFFFDNAAHK